MTCLRPTLLAATLATSALAGAGIHAALALPARSAGPVFERVHEVMDVLGTGALVTALRA